MARRLRAVLPDRWFADETPVLFALLHGFGAIWAALYQQIAFVVTQSRLATVSGAFLDMAAVDYKGAAFLRRLNETDTQFRARVLPIFRDKVTRAAVLARLLDLTGNPAIIIEPSRPADTGGYGIACGYGAGGAYGSLVTPNQFFVQATRPAGQGLAGFGGYGGPGGYGAGMGYGDITQELPHVTDADIYEAIDATRPLGSIAWTALAGSGAPAPAPLGQFVLGENTLA